MCEECWKEHGKPAIRNEKTLGVQPLIEAVYEEHAGGGGLHIIIDDYNVHDSHIDMCAKDVTTDAEKACLEAFRAMTIEERVSALAIYDGCAIVEDLK